MEKLSDRAYDILRDIVIENDLIENRNLPLGGSIDILSIQLRNPDDLMLMRKIFDNSEPGRNIYEGNPHGFHYPDGIGIDINNRKITSWVTTSKIISMSSFLKILKEVSHEISNNTER